MLRAWGRCLERGLEVRCRRADVEAKRYEDLELVRHAAGLDILEVWKYAAGVLPQEIWNSDGMLWA